MNQLFIHWNLHPEIFPDTAIPIRWYGLLFAFAFVTAYIILRKIFLKENVSVKILDDLTLYVGIGTIAGARLGHCLFYQPEIYLNDPIRILKVWEGGLASHGAAIGILIALALFARRYRFNFIAILDRIAIVIPVAGAFVRLGNLANSEIYGNVTSLPWGFYFQHSIEIQHRTQPHHPTQIYEALAYFLIFILLWCLYKKRAALKPGFIFGIFLTTLFSMRFLIEFIKEPQVDFEITMALNMGQILSLPFVIAGIIIVIYSLKKKWKDEEVTLVKTEIIEKNSSE